MINDSSENFTTEEKKCYRTEQSNMWLQQRHIHFLNNSSNENDFSKFIDSILHQLLNNL